MYTLYREQIRTWIKVCQQCWLCMTLTELQTLYNFKLGENGLLLLQYILDTHKMHFSKHRQLSYFISGPLHTWELQKTHKSHGIDFQKHCRWPVLNRGPLACNNKASFHKRLCLKRIALHQSWTVDLSHEGGHSNHCTIQPQHDNDHRFSGWL